MARERLKKYLLRRIPAAMFVCALLFLYTAVKITDFADWYAVTVYPIIVRYIGGFWGIIPLSVGELLIYSSSCSVIVFVFRLIHSRHDKKKLALMLRRGIQALAWIIAILFVLFTFNCGINYHRRPFSESVGYYVSSSSKDELAALCGELIAQANLSSNLVNTSNNGVTCFDAQYQDLAASASFAMEKLGQRYPSLAAYYPKAKPVLFSKGMSYLNITGVYFPFTVEANVNVNAPDYQMPATICHELSHLCGFMREDEANFIAYLACCSSEDPRLQYSGYMLALVHALNALYSADYSLWARQQAEMNERVQADFKNNSDYWKRFDGTIRTVSNMVNDTYLKVNAQSDGVNSYGRMVDLLIAEYRMRASTAPEAIVAA